MILTILEKAAKEAGKILLENYKKNTAFTYKKSHKSLLTKVDRDSQKLIINIISKGLISKGVDISQIGFIGEEEGIFNIKKYTFIIDPLDGTTNFVNGFDYFAVSIGYFLNNLPEAGVIYLPTKNIMFSAQKNKGAWKSHNGSKTKLKIIPSEIKNSVAVSLITTREEYRENSIRRILKIFPHVRGLRFICSCACDMVNLADNIWQIGLNYGYIWDMAAGYMIIKESGGSITDMSGNKLEFNLTDFNKVYEMLICHPKNIKEIITLIKA